MLIGCATSQSKPHTIPVPICSHAVDLLLNHRLLKFLFELKRVKLLSMSSRWRLRQNIFDTPLCIATSFSIGVYMYSVYHTVHMYIDIHNEEGNSRSPASTNNPNYYIITVTLSHHIISYHSSVKPQRLSKWW